MTSLKFSLTDKNLMARFEQDVYYPLLDYLPKQWFIDFEDIILKFDSSEYLSFAGLRDKVFILNIDLNRLEQLMKQHYEQKKEKVAANTVILGYFANLALIVTRAFHKYNVDKHPEAVKDTPEQIAYTFMDSVLKNMRRVNNKWQEYTI